MRRTKTTLPLGPAAASRLLLTAKWLALSTLIATVYGIVNDQLTVTLSPEYFSVFKREQFGPFLFAAGMENVPIRLQAIAVGALATWWFGLLLGFILSFAGIRGNRAPISTLIYRRVVLGMVLFTFALSVAFGVVAYAIEPILKPTAANFPFLADIHDIRSAFAVGSWHDGAYLGGVLGTIFGVVYFRRLRAISSDPVG